MSLKDTTTFKKLNSTNNYLLWQHNNSHNLWTYVKKDYQHVINLLAHYNKEIFNSLASSFIKAALQPPQDPDLIVSSSVVPLGKKALLLQTKKLSKAREQANTTQAEALLAKSALKKDSASPSLLNRARKTANVALTTTKKANLLQTSLTKPTTAKSPFKDNKDLTWFLSYAHKIQSGSSQTHTLISASLNTQLQNYINYKLKNPFWLWSLIKEHFHNKAFNLKANLYT
ncbi:uncharacterized protein ACA1_193510 [Acanthamoeba castellanii str. Neff]|uniref:Uncharacterized protein n=1 Tax=Acanthamoeba castellanii (strain ATCC 30010 / Neff) TaxID=1257118 RepID=L8GPI1_ACACF|nr:uncharacterized protein ACA1_193510 [Acanthamoeba castellanii str. Neff]ELR14538.1 hypothetical protein ACA1_193510 [Acanthamoeba castellanii str. Neff]